MIVDRYLSLRPRRWVRFITDSLLHSELVTDEAGDSDGELKMKDNKIISPVVIGRFEKNITIKSVRNTDADVLEILPLFQ